MLNRLPILVLLALGLTACPSGQTPPAEKASETPAETAQDQAAAAEEEQAVEGHDAGEASDEEALLNRADPAGVYGNGVQLTETATIAAILDQPAGYEGKTVRVTGEVAEVCPRRGCWIDVADPASGLTMRVKVKDGDIVFPLSAKGRTIEVEGEVQKIEMDEEQARNWKQHEAEERGEEFDPASVTGPMVMWRIWGVGAEIKS